MLKRIFLIAVLTSSLSFCRQGGRSSDSGTASNLEMSGVGNNGDLLVYRARETSTDEYTSDVKKVSQILSELRSKKELFEGDVQVAQNNGKEEYVSLDFNVVKYLAVCEKNDLHMLFSTYKEAVKAGLEHQARTGHSFSPQKL